MTQLLWFIVCDVCVAICLECFQTSAILHAFLILYIFPTTIAIRPMKLIEMSIEGGNYELNCELFKRML